VEDIYLSALKLEHLLSCDHFFQSCIIEFYFFFLAAHYMRLKKERVKGKTCKKKMPHKKKQRGEKKENKTKQNKRAAPKKKERRREKIRKCLHPLSPHAELYCCLLELGLERVYTGDID
jgi:hypothetical protein